jgi:predicted nucleotidyltransferase
MSRTLSEDKVLTRLRHRLNRLYGARLARAVLYGSRARGDWNADSDYDVAVFLTEITDWRPDQERLADLRVELFDETGALLDIHPFRASEWPDRTPLMGEIRREGVDL